MNSSPSRSRVPARAGTADLPPASLPFPYHPVPAGPGSRSGRIEGFGETVASDVELGAAEAAGDREKSASALAFQEGQAAARKSFDDQVEQVRTGIDEALSQFSRDRAAYFEKVEGEVVQLALSIAAKILHREAQLDRTLLAGIVRVALEKIERGTGVVLRVHPQKLFEWQQYFALHMRPEDRPEIAEDASQEPEQCTLQTAMGTAVIGLEVQLKEIEQGLMDLLAVRPGVSQ
jgi:flagellar assembly protein FliH